MDAPQEPPGDATPPAGGPPAGGPPAGGSTAGQTNGAPARELRYTWAAWYTPAWDDDPGAYVAHEVVAWGYSRRLARVVGDVGVPGDGAFKAYLGVQHYDPGRWGVAGEPHAVFFLSLFLAGCTLSLRTYPTLALAIDALEAAYQRINTGV